MLLERAALQMFAHAAFETLQCRDERLRDIAAAERTVAPVGVRKPARDGVREQPLAIDVG